MLSRRVSYRTASTFFNSRIYICSFLCVLADLTVWYLARNGDITVYLVDFWELFVGKVLT